MDKQELLALASACERLTDFETPEAEALNNALHGVLPEPKCVQPPNYRANISAAIGLLPESLVFNLGNDVGGWAYVWNDTPEYNGEPHEGRAATPALALCAAALRAIASQEGE